AYCQDNEIGWINWSPEARDEGMLRFFRLLIAFRRSNALLRRATFAHNGEIHIDWHGVETGWPDWSHNSHSLAMQLSGPGLGEIYVVANAYWEPLKFALPKPTEAARWMRFVDTTYESPDDVLEEKDLRPLPDPLHYRVGPRSVVILVAR
ncbi:MAG TPA: glycogen debranching enzyme, partial [Solibacterales bacterium]|nr:glycogen debranching enzyme [Bryobacterales bacterium]